jgi:hypothetical protein
MPESQPMLLSDQERMTLAAAMVFYRYMLGSPERSQRLAELPFFHSVKPLTKAESDVLLAKISGKVILP